MRVAYKSFPFRNRGVPEQTRIWRPILSVQIIHNHAKSPRFEAIIDTGSDYCLFHASIGASMGIKIHDGAEGDLGGVIAGPRSKVYYHNVKLVVGTDIVDIKAGFSWDLTENLLGYIGFFDSFIVTLIRRPNRHVSTFKESNGKQSERRHGAQISSVVSHAVGTLSGV